MEHSARSSKVTGNPRTIPFTLLYLTHRFLPLVEYTDPSSIYPVISGDLKRQLPLRNLHWNSATRPLRSIASLHIDLVKASDGNTPLAIAEKNDVVAQHGAEDSGERRGALQRTNQHGSGAGAKKERRHQIPGLRQTPYLKVFFLRCSDVETYRSTYRKELREWVRDNTPPSQTTAAINAQEFHDAYEWLIVHVVLPDDGRSVLRVSNTSKNDVRNGYRGSDAVTDKIRADFNGTAKTAVDRVAQVQITRDSETISTTVQNQDPAAGWDEFISKAKSLILSSFDLRVTQYEEDIKERDAQRNIPGWNFNTFFVLKEGLARGFESVGLVEDALIGYQELAAGLSAIIGTNDNSGQQQGLFKTCTNELSVELKRVLQSEHSQHVYGTKNILAGSYSQNGHEAKDRTVLGSNVLDTDRKPFRELILANEISIFDFRCYLFARESSLLLRLASDSRIISNNNGASTADDRLENVDALPGAAKPDAKDLLLLSEVCRRAVNFFASAGRLIRDDLRASIDPLSKGHMTVDPSSFSSVEDPIEDIVASWTYSACQCILDITNVPSLTSQLQALLRTLKPPDEVCSNAEGPTRLTSRDRLPQRTSPLPARACTSPNSSTPVSFPSITSLDAIRLLPTGSTQTGTQELAAQRAELFSLERRVVASLGRRSSNIQFDCIDLVSSLSSSKHCMVEVSLEDALTDTNCQRNGEMTLNSNQVNNLQNEKLRRIFASEDTYIKGYELATFYHNNDWTRLETPMLDLYAQTLKLIDRKEDFCRVGLHLLAKTTSRERLSYVSAAEGAAQEILDLGHYLQDILSVSKSLARPLSAPLHHYFGGITLDPYIHHYEERDGFYMLLKLQNQMSKALAAHEVQVKIVNVNEEQPCVIWLRTAIPELLQPGINEILVQTTTTCPGWYRLERIDVRSANIVFTYDKAAPTSNGLFGPPFGADTVDQVNEANSTPILVWSDERALGIQLSLHTSIELGKPRSLQVLIFSSQNNISKGKLDLRACSAGLRLHTADADTKTDNGLTIGQPQAGSIEYGTLDAGSQLSVRIPYSLETDLTEIKVKVEVSYIVDGKEYFHLCNAELSIQLPLSVNVQDYFKERALFSNFKIDTASSIPARISDYTIQDTRFLQVTMPPAPGSALIIFASQPLSLVAEIKRDTASLQGEPTASSDDRVLMLRIRYACLDQEVRTAVEDTLRTALRDSPFYYLSRLLVGAFGEALQSKFTVLDLETVGLLGHIHIAHFQHYDWDLVLGGLHPEKRAEITSWLTEWHAVRILTKLKPGKLLTVFKEHTIISFPQEIDRRNALELIVPVGVPRMPLVITGQLDVLGCRTGPGEAQFAGIDQALLAEVFLQYSWDWASEPRDFTTPDEFDITYELQASPDIWLIGGQRKAYFSAKNAEARRFPIVLLPQKTGLLQYPSLEVRVTQPQGNERQSADAETISKEIIASEVDYLNQAESILIIPNLRSSTIRRGEDMEAVIQTFRVHRPRHTPVVVLEKDWTQRALGVQINCEDRLGSRPLGSSVLLVLCMLLAKTAAGHM
ncbi:MAG: hypothetical protein Q9225_002792 [Loekoesia sp. 1 TL-2023]